MKQWERDDTWQRAIRDRFLTPFYKRICVDGRFVYFQKSDASTLIQKRMSVDTALQIKPDRSDCIEEKIIRQPWSSFFFETDSCTLPGKHSDGWMCYTQADALLYAFFCQHYLDTYIIRDFQDVKMWFWQVYTSFPERTMTTDNKTRGRLVPIADVTAFAKVTHIHIFDNGLYKPASREVAA